MVKIYLVVVFGLYCDLIGSQGINCFDKRDFANTSMTCDEHQQYTLQNKYGKKGFLNPYTTEIRFNNIVDENNKNYN